MSEVFSAPAFAENGEQILTTYENAFAWAGMDIRVYRMRRGETRVFSCPGEETAALLLRGKALFEAGPVRERASREDVFRAGPYCAHASYNDAISVTALEAAEVLVQRARNGAPFPVEFYTPRDVSAVRVGEGKYGNIARRNVVTVFDADISPRSNMVLGEIVGDAGNWSSFPPHSHPQPEVYYFLFDKPDGFGACFVGDEVYKSVSGSFAAIPGGLTHPQACSPGFTEYTCWMIRHLPENKWLQTDRNIDPRYDFLG